jgi:hypothetical protein
VDKRKANFHNKTKMKLKIPGTIHLCDTTIEGAPDGVFDMTVKASISAIGTPSNGEKYINIDILEITPPDGVVLTEDKQKGKSRGFLNAITEAIEYAASKPSKKDSDEMDEEDDSSEEEDKE